MTSNYYCYNAISDPVKGVTVPSAVAGPAATPGSDYDPTKITGTLYMSNHQVSADIFMPIFSDPATNINRLLLVTLTSVTNDPAEANLVRPPGIYFTTNTVTDEAYSNAWVNIIGTANDAVDICNQTNSVVTLERASVLTSEFYGDAPGATNGDGVNYFVERYGNLTQPCTVTWYLDYLPNCRPDTFNQFPLQPGSDYSYPNTNFAAITGTISFAAFDNVPKPIHIPLSNDLLVAFNGDIRVILTNATTTSYGFMTNGTVTIVSDDQPAGAIDKLHNPSNYRNSQSRQLNPNPGANDIVNTAALAVQSDGKTVIAGEFTAFNTAAAELHRPHDRRRSSSDTSTSSAGPTAGPTVPSTPC